jgi:hypothetical protein
MQKNASLLPRACLVFFAAALTAACVNNRDITGSTERAAFASRVQQPVSYRELNPPPSAVEIRAQCWMRHEREVADLDAKTQLVQQCMSDRMRGTEPR